MGPSVTARQAECIVGLLYAVLSAGTIRLTGDGQGLAAVWPANAVLLAALLDRRPDGWGRLLAVGYLANVATGLAMRGVGPAPFLDGLCHVAEAWIAARLLRPVLNGEDVLVAPSVVGRFILVCGLVAPALSGLGGAAVASLVSGRDPRVAFGSWVTGNGLGLLVFTPFLFALLRGDYRRCLTGKDWSRRAEALGLQGLVAATACGVFCVAERSLLFVLFGPAMLATFRVGRLGTKAAVAVIAVIGTVATLRGQGPIAAVTPDPHEQATLLHAFLAVLLLTCLPVAAALTAQGRNLRSLSRSAEALRAQRAELARLAATDGLTGVLNRTAFREAALAAMRDPGRSRAWSRSTSTCSSRSTTGTATSRATGRWSTWSRSCAPACARPTRSGGSAATSSWSCSPGPMPTGRRRWRRACARPCAAPRSPSTTARCSCCRCPAASPRTGTGWASRTWSTPPTWRSTAPSAPDGRRGCCRRDPRPAGRPPGAAEAGDDERPRRPQAGIIRSSHSISS